MEFTAEWLPEAQLWETKNYGRYDEVDYIRTFLGRDQAYIPVKNVLIFETAKGHYRANPFMKQTVDSLHYNQIEIIAFDQGELGGEDDYRNILSQCGYPYIEKFAIPSSFGKKNCGFKFFQAAVETYSPGKKKYGMISNTIVPFAMAKHVDFLMYTSPDLYPQRYYLGRKTREEERTFENFINEQLFNGTVKESRGYHFGYAFEGILMYAFCQFLKKRMKEENASRIYFTAASGTAFQAYSMLYPEDELETLYAWSQTRRDGELEQYMKNRTEKKGIIGDFSLDQDWKSYLEGQMGERLPVVNLQDLFQPENVKKYGKVIDQAVSMVQENNFFVAEYKNGLPVWGQKKTGIRKLRNGQEIQRGMMGFVTQFDAFRKQTGWEKTVCGKEDVRFIGRVLKYAFNEGQRKKRHMKPAQALIQSRAAKWGVRQLKKIYRRIRKR